MRWQKLLVAVMLMFFGMTQEGKAVEVLNKDNFEETVSKGVTLVDFYADWCGPCKMIAPVLEELDKDFKGKAKIVKVDVDQSGEVAQEFGVSSIPTLILFKDGKKVDQVVGVQDKDALAELIKNHL